MLRLCNIHRRLAQQLRPFRTNRAASSGAALSVLKEGEVSLLRRSDNPSSGNVYLIGTAHISERSSRLVNAVVSAVRPATVVVELCSEREGFLRRREPQSQWCSCGCVDVCVCWQLRTALEKTQRIH